MSMTTLLACGLTGSGAMPGRAATAVAGPAESKPAEPPQAVKNAAPAAANIIFFIIMTAVAARKNLALQGSRQTFIAFDNLVPLSIM